MRKLFAGILSMAMMMSLATTTFAAEPITAKDGTDSKNVTATYKIGEDGGTVYSVDISWGSMEFTYTSAAAGTWTPESHTYANTAAEKWECDDGANEIIVTNHTNAAVEVGLEYAQASGFEAVSGSFDNSTLNLATAVNTAVDKAPSATAKLTLSGSLSSGTVAGTTIGTVTVTLK